MEDATNDRLNLTLIAPGPGYDETVVIEAGDECKVSRECGVDGNIAATTPQCGCPVCGCNRRNDCNGHILYLGGFSIGYGGTIYRRFYLKFSSDYVIPAVGQKIGYYLYPYTLATVIASSFGRIDVEGNIPFTFYNQAPLFPFQKDRWYYIEEMIKTQSADGQSDGEYCMWLAFEGDDPGDPIIHVINEDLRPANALSIWGNSQFYEDRAGYAYVDDVVVSSERIGPTNISFLKGDVNTDGQINIQDV